MRDEAASPAAAAHVVLRFGRLMLARGADAGRVQADATRLARQLGYDAQIMVGTESILLTLEDGQGFRTKLGHAVAGMTVDMGALAALGDILREAPATMRRRPTEPGIAALDRRLDAIEHAGGRYPPWLVALGMGVTAASLARLFDGAWPVVAASGLVGIVSLILRRALGAWAVNPIATAALVALLSGLAGAVAMRAFPGTPPTLSLVAAGMILVPGVPLLNGVREVLAGHAASGLARLATGTITILAIAFGLFAAGAIVRDALPVAGSVELLPVAEDLPFSALAAVGFALLFNVPLRAAWACLLCAVAGHGLRTALAHAGLNLVAGSAVAAFAAGLLARGLAQRFGVPSATFAFPGVLPMIPGSYAFRAAIGGLAIMDAGGGASIELIGTTIGLALTAVLMTAAIGIGLSLAIAAPSMPSSRGREATGVMR